MIIVCGAPAGEIDDKSLEAAGVHGRLEPAGKANEDGEDDPEIEIEEECAPKRSHVFIFLP